MHTTFTIKKKFLFVYFIGLSIFPTRSIFSQSFSSKTLQGAVVGNPTSLQFGPDDKLYVGMQGGEIKIFTIEKNGGNYKVTNTESIMLVKQMPNHNDDGKPNTSVTSRQVTGILVAGTAANPILYVSSSDSRMGAGVLGDINLCTNSGVISKLTKNGSTWKKVDLVRGLPRSEDNHSPNGMQLDAEKNILFISIGGLTNAGGPSKMWTYISEYALSGAILSVDLDVIEAMSEKEDATGNHPYKYDIPTLDDPTRANRPDGTDENDPFGGNDGLNQAKIVAGGPVQVYAPGFRNAYDIVITKTQGSERRMYTIDNGANVGWGGPPKNEGVGTATNDYPVGEPGSIGPGEHDPEVNNLDGLEFIGNLDTYVSGSYYGGHPVPVRANPSGAGLLVHQGSINGGTKVWRTSKTDEDNPLPADWPPVPKAHPIEGDYQNPGEKDNSILTFSVSTNGICEYTADNFGMKGDLLAIDYDGKVYRIKLNDIDHSVLNGMGASKLNKDAPLASGLAKSLDITAQGDDDIFPGTIWVACYGSNTIVAFEPQDVVCTGEDNTNDDDFDNYTNADEIDNGTDPCSGASKPNDYDGDQKSDLNDTDDDNDGISDKQDYFSIDAENGLTTEVPTHYALFNFEPGTGFFGLGFTGLMSNGTTDYLDQFDEDNLVAGGAAGVLTVNQVPKTNPTGNIDNQEYAFQFGVNVSTATGPFTVKSGILGPFFSNKIPQGSQSQGIYIGTGDQDNYIKIALNANDGNGGIQVVYENGGVADSAQYNIPNMPVTSVYFYLYVDPATKKVQPYYSLDNGETVSLGSPIVVSGPLMTAITSSSKALAVGIIASSNGGPAFTASWDFISVTAGLSITGIWDQIKTTTGIVVYPNPTRDKLYFNCENKDLVNSTVSINIYHSSGRIIQSAPMKMTSVQNGQSIDMSAFSQGVYLIKIVNDREESLESFKIIKY